MAISTTGKRLGQLSVNIHHASLEAGKIAECGSTNGIEVESSKRQSAFSSFASFDATDGMYWELSLNGCGNTVA